MYRTVVTICITSLTFNNSTFCPHTVFMCFVWISEQTAIISLYSINWLVFITETECVYCAVRTGEFIYESRSWIPLKQLCNCSEMHPAAWRSSHTPHYCTALNGSQSSAAPTTAKDSDALGMVSAISILLRSTCIPSHPTLGASRPSSRLQIKALAHEDWGHS